MQKTAEVIDLIVVGGGINGAGIAADAAGRGLSVALFEAQDFAGATSSASSKLIHGGLRYLEHYEFRLVAEALSERETLLNKAPHLVEPMRFILPYRPQLRPAWMLRCGLFLYDHLAARSCLQGSKQVDLNTISELNPPSSIGFEYSDCWVDDARLVLANLQLAERLGTEVKNYCHVVDAKVVDGCWKVKLEDTLTGEKYTRYSRALINATGPWAADFIQQKTHQISPKQLRLVQGSHFVVPKLSDAEQAFILQNEDKRIVFVIPYLEHYSMVGTTDVEYTGSRRNIEITEQETDYLIKVVNQHFSKQISKQDILWSFSGVRPLLDDQTDAAQAVTRDYHLELQTPESNTPMLTVFGGKLTTYRKLAEKAVNQLEPYFSYMGATWTKSEALPGGNFSGSREQFSDALQTQFPWLTKSLAKRYVNQYGNQARRFMTHQEQEMGRIFAEGVYQKELDYLMAHEFVRQPEDLLWRRTKLGLTLSPEEKEAISQYILNSLVSQDGHRREA